MDDLLQLHAKVKPSSFTGGIVWSSSDDSIATVDSNGLVTALAAGVVEITATSVDTGSDGKPGQPNLYRNRTGPHAPPGHSKRPD